MVNITHKSNTLREAVATAIVQVSLQETIEAIKNRTIPKGDVFEFSRAAGLLAIKKTSDVIPDCHPLPVEFASIKYSIAELQIHITVEVHTIYKTGVEVEAMHGAAITALTMYDMLKPVDKQVEINSIKLSGKTGGKTTFIHDNYKQLQIAVIVCSDRIATGLAKDISGLSIVEKIQKYGLETSSYQVIPDDISTIRQTVLALTGGNLDLVLITGGTGLSPRDVTPEAIKPLLEREIPGIAEAARNYGQQRTPFAMLSRSVAGFIKNTLVITMPGSAKGVAETMDALFPYVFHIFDVANGSGH